jgi:large subunit ribosomal protein L6
MSRIGKKFIEIPKDITVEVKDGLVSVSGAKGKLQLQVQREITVEAKDGKVLVAPLKEVALGNTKALWGLYRALIANMVEGVSKGFEKKLEIEGVGFKAAVQGDELVLNLGFVNPVKVKKPEGITFAVEKNLITVSGISKEAVGQIAAQIRATKKAEPYKGKGIKYQGERIRRKEGKKVVATKK